MLSSIFEHQKACGSPFPQPNLNPFGGKQEEVSIYNPTKPKYLFKNINLAYV
jgi:hypothetical protein